MSPLIIRILRKHGVQKNYNNGLSADFPPPFFTKNALKACLNRVIASPIFVPVVVFQKDAPPQQMFVDEIYEPYRQIPAADPKPSKPQ